MNFARFLCVSSLVLSLAMIAGCQSPSVGEYRPSEPADVPVTRSVEREWMSIARWYRMHADDVEVARQGEVDVLFLGDSITESWDWKEGHDRVFSEYFGRYRTANFGVGGDQTQHLLWRLQNGAHGQLDPKVVVLMIGVNNFNQGGHGPDDVAAGVQAVLAQVKENFPSAKILLNGIFPYEEKASSRKRQLVRETNQRLSQFADGQTVYFYDFGDEIFLDANGDIPRELMDDFLHPSAEGMRRFAQKIQPVVAGLLTP